MHKYKLISKKGEGTFSEVLKSQSIKTGKYVAIKCMKSHFDSIEQVNNLREIQALRKLSPHPHVVKLIEVLYDEPTGRLALVFELMDMNLYEAIKGRRNYLNESKVKHYMYQLLKSIEHMHKNGIFHRDIKPENILIVDDVLKLADLGSCRGIFSKQPYTEYISTRWYRAPECLLTDGYYSYKMDIWGYGCVFFEVLSLFPLFPGNNEVDQIAKIHNILGTPSKELLAKFKKYGTHMDFNFPQKEGTGIAKLTSHISPECMDLIEKCLVYNPDDRISAKQAMKHPYFRDLYEQDKRIHMAMNSGPSSTLRGTHNEIHSDNQSENLNNISQHSHNPLGHINVNINTNNSSQRMDISINMPKKKGLFPDIKRNMNTYQDDSDNDQSSKFDMPIPKRGLNPMNITKKPSKHIGMIGGESIPSTQKHIAISKITMQKSNKYVSPYSQKAIVGQKPY